MRSKVILIVTHLIQIWTLVHSDLVLFEQGYIKFMRHGKRELHLNVEHIDNKIIDHNKHLVIVKTRSLPILHPEAVRNLKNLQELIIANCAVQKIEKKAFFNLPNLTSLHLQDNQLHHIKQGIFNGLPIKILALQRNVIKKIDSHAFNDMPNLYKIKLNNNRLKTWDIEWFNNLPKLTEIYFRRNRLNYLPPNAFSNIKGSHLIDGEIVIDTKIFLSKNKLGQINPESFYNLEAVSQLFLDRNNISEIPNEAFRDLKEIDVIYLARNKITEINANAFPKVRKIGILDLSSNLLECLPYNLLSVANLTNLEKNNGTCKCANDYKAKLLNEDKNNQINADASCWE